MYCLIRVPPHCRSGAVALNCGRTHVTATPNAAVWEPLEGELCWYNKVRMKKLKLTLIININHRSQGYSK